GHTANVGQGITAEYYNGQLQLYYYDATNGILRHAWTSSGTWHFENLDGDAGSVSGYSADVGQDPSVTTYNGQLELFYYDATNGNLRHAWTVSGDWHFENLDGDPGSISGFDGDVGQDPTALVSSSGHIHLFYFYATNGNL